MSTGRTNSVRKLTRVGAVIELLFDVDTPGKFVQLNISLPNRGPGITRTWMLGSAGLLDSAATSDLCTYIN